MQVEAAPRPRGSRVKAIVCAWFDTAQVRSDVPRRTLRVIGLPIRSSGVTARAGRQRRAKPRLRGQGQQHFRACRSEGPTVLKLARAVAVITGSAVGKATTATIRHRAITVPARIASSARGHPPSAAEQALGPLSARSRGAQDVSLLAARLGWPEKPGSILLGHICRH